MLREAVWGINTVQHHSGDTAGPGVRCLLSAAVKMSFHSGDTEEDTRETEETKVTESGEHRVQDPCEGCTKRIKNKNSS